MLKTRVLTAVVMTLVILPLLWFSYLPYLMNAFVAVMVLLTTYELFHACVGKIGNEKKETISFGITALLAAALQFVPLPKYSTVLAVLWVLAVLVFAFFMPRIPSFKVKGIPQATLLSLLVSFFFRSVSELCQLGHGNYFVLLCLATSILTEMTGYFVGRALGKHKLAPALSPGKSVEGAVSACILPPLFLLLIIFILTLFCNLTVRWGYFIFYLFLGTFVTQFGDLAFSLIKRASGIKDFGKVLPGHGGILDRFDAQCFLAPYTFLFVSFFGEFLLW